MKQAQNCNHARDMSDHQSLIVSEILNASHIRSSFGASLLERVDNSAAADDAITKEKKDDTFLQHFFRRRKRYTSSLRGVGLEDLSRDHGEQKTVVVYNYIVLAASGSPSASAAKAAAAAAASYLTSSGVSATGDSYDPAFGDHVDNLRGTMFYVCQGSCLCGTVNNRGKVIYCYGDLVPRQGELFAEGGEQNGKTSSKDLLAAQLGLWTFGIFAL